MILLQTSLSLSLYMGWGVQVSNGLQAAMLTTANFSFPYWRTILAVVGLILGAAALLGAESICRSRHNRAIEREARELGLTFSACAKPFEGSDVHGLPLVQGDSSVEASNVVQAVIDGRQALVFDLPSCEGFEAETPHQPFAFTTVAAFRCSGGDVPEFEIGRKCLLSKVSDAFRKKPAVIEDRQFAKEFFVHCAEPKKVHDWLTPARLEKLRPAVAPFHVSANKDWIFIVRPGAQIPPEQFPMFLQESSKIVGALLQ